MPTSTLRAAAAEPPPSASSPASVDPTGPLAPEAVWASIPDGIIVFSPDWRFRFVNAAAEQIIGRRSSELMGRNLWEEFPAVVGTELEQVCRRSMQSGRAWDLDVRSTRGPQWYHVKTYPSPLGLTVCFNEVTERLEAEQARRVTHERFHLAAATPWLTLYEQDADLRYTWLYPPHPEHAHALGKSDAELSQHGSLDLLIALKRQVMQTGQPARREVAVTLAGTERWYDTYIAPRYDTEGSVTGVTGAALEITERKRTESVLRDTEERLRATYWNAPIGIAEADFDGRLISVNGTYCRQLGYTAAEMLGRPFADFTHPDDRAESASDFHALLAGTGGDATRERRYLHRDGHTVWAAVTRTLIRDAAGTPKFAVAIAEDISQRKAMLQRQAQLFRLVAAVNHADRLEQIYEAALDALTESYQCQRGAILLADSAGVMRFAASRGLSDAYRRAVEGHTPWAPDDPDPQPVCIPDVATSTLQVELVNVLRREGIAAVAFIPLTSERRLLGKFMVYFDQPCDFSVVGLQLAETIARQVGFAIERQRAAEHLETLVRTRTASLHEAIQQMEEFSYTVSHDLRAPVRGMLTYATVLLEDHAAELSPTVRDFLQRIVKNARRMDDLVRDTLAYSRVARGELRLQPVSLDEAARLAISEASAPAAITIEGTLGHATGHEPLVVQVFSNLLNNAVKFVRSGVPARVRVQAHRTGSRVRVSVADNGIGIAPPVQARAFKIFERLHTAPHYEGTGIGLAIVRKAIERMGGEVGLESDGTSGTTVWFELPAATEARESPTAG